MKAQLVTTTLTFFFLSQSQNCQLRLSLKKKKETLVLGSPYFMHFLKKHYFNPKPDIPSGFEDKFAKERYENFKNIPMVVSNHLGSGSKDLQEFEDMMVRVGNGRVWDGSPLSHAGPKIFNNIPYPSQTLDWAACSILSPLCNNFLNPILVPSQTRNYRDFRIFKI